MRATTPLLKKATRRLPLTSKTGGKDYYKGHGTGSMGSHTIHGGYRLDYNKIRTYVVPDMRDNELTATVRAYSTQEAQTRLRERRERTQVRVNRLVRSLEGARSAAEREKGDLEGRVELGLRDLEEGEEASAEEVKGLEERRAEVQGKLDALDGADKAVLAAEVEGLDAEIADVQRTWASKRAELETHIAELEEELASPATAAMSLPEAQRQLTLEFEESELEYLDSELSELGEAGERKRAAEKAVADKREAARKRMLEAALGRTAGVRKVLQRDFVRFEGATLKKAYVKKILRERNAEEDRLRVEREELSRARTWLKRADWMPMQLDLETEQLAGRQLEVDGQWEALERDRAERMAQLGAKENVDRAAQADEALQAQVDEEFAPRQVELEERQAELDEERLALEERRGSAAVFFTPDMGRSADTITA